MHTVRVLVFVPAVIFRVILSAIVMDRLVDWTVHERHVSSQTFIGSPFIVFSHFMWHFITPLVETG
jgi:hypothetical protein